MARVLLELSEEDYDQHIDSLMCKVCVEAETAAVPDDSSEWKMLRVRGRIGTIACEKCDHRFCDSCRGKTVADVVMCAECSPYEDEDSPDSVVTDPR